MKIEATSTFGKKKTILTGKDKINQQRLEKGEMFPCPGCGEPLEFGATKCTRCGAFLDKDGNKRGDVSDAELNAQISEALEERKKGKWVGLIGLAVLTVGYIINGGLGIFIIIVGSLTAVIGFLMYKAPERRFKAQLGNSLIPMVLGEMFDNVEYRHDGQIDNSIIYNTNMHFPFDFDEINAGDYFKAEYKGVGIEMCDLSLIEITTETTTDDDGNEHETERRDEVFKGQWIILDFHKELTADLCVFERTRNPLFRSKQLETENEAFNKRFGIACDNAHDAFYILTPHMMEHIMNMDDMAGAKTYMRFLTEGKVYIAFQSGRDHFEVGNLKNANIDDLRSKFRGEIRYVTDLIDEFLSLDSMYK